MSVAGVWKVSGIWFVVAGFVVLGLAGLWLSDGRGGGGGVEPAPGVSAGEWVEAGRLSVRLGVECGLGSHSVGFGGTQPDGEYCVATWDVRNDGDRPARLDGDPELVDGDGRRHGVDAFSRELREVNPGQQVRVEAAFDVPADVRPDVVEFEGVRFDASG